MNPYYLFLIVPVSVMFGFFICAILAIGSKTDLENKIIMLNKELGDSERKTIEKCIKRVQRTVVEHSLTKLDIIDRLKGLL